MLKNLRFRHAHLIAAAVSLVGLAGIWGAAKAYEVAAYRTMVSEAYLESERSAHRLAVHAALMLAQTERVMTLVKYEHERGSAVDFDSMGRAGLLGAIDDVTVSIADRRGRITASTRMADVGAATFADRPYFRRASEQTDVSFGEPTLGRISKRWVVPAALRLLDRDGKFDGAVLLAFNAETLTRGYRHDDDPNTTVGVLGGDGIFRSRLVGSTHGSGQRIGVEGVTKLTEQHGKRKEPSISPIDHIARYPSIVPIPGTDWIAIVSTSAAPSLAQHAELKKRLYGSAFGASFALLLMVLALLRQANRVNASELARGHEHQLHRNMIDAIPASIALIDADGRIAMLNAAWRDRPGATGLAGSSPSGDYLQVHRETFGPDEATQKTLEARFADARRGSTGLPPIEYLGFANGHPQWFRCVMVPLGQATGNQVVALNLNVHERKVAEEALRRSETLSSIAGRVARIGGWSMAAGSDELIFSDELSAIYDWPPGQTVQLQVWLSLFPADARAEVEEGLRHCLIDGLPFDVEVESSTSSGRTFWARSIARAIRDGQGQIVEIHGAVQDATERHRVEAEARDIKARLDVALGSMTDAFCTLDKDWRFTYLNPETERLLQSSRGQLLGQPIWEALTERAIAVLQPPLTDAVLHRTSVHVEDIHAPSGAWCEARAYPSDDGVAIYLRDTSEQRRIQQQLRLMETCTKKMNDPVVISEAPPGDLPGPPRIVFVNDALLRSTGYTREELIGQTPQIFHGPNTEGAELDRIRTALETRKPIRTQLTHYKKSGVEYWIELDVQPVFSDDGETVQFLAVQHDITEQRLDRERLRSSNRDLESMVKARTAQLAFSNASLQAREQEISSVLQNMADCVLSIDHQGRVRSANDSVEALFGYPASALIGEPLSTVLDLAGGHADGADATRADASTGAPLAAVGLHRSGERIAVEVVFTEYAVNQQTRSTVIVRDVRERLKVVAELEQARVHAEEASKAKSAFVATMSHEIRTPMNGVIGMIDVLRETPLARDQSQMLELARESAYALMEVVESVLDFSKIEAGKVDVETAAMSLPHVLGKVFDFAHTLGYKRGVRMSLFVDPEIPPAVLGDAIKIRQVLLNLLSNAIKFCSGDTSAGAVEMRATLLHRHGDDIRVSITVRDNGIGMDDATLARLFQSFTQADASTTRRFGGTGLGLTIARDLTRLIGGAISVESRVAQGSVFTVELPFAVVADAAEDKAFPIAAGDRVLLVGGESGFVDDLRAYLHHAGADVSAVAELGADDPHTSPSFDSQTRLCVFAERMKIDAIESLRASATPEALRATPWVALLAEGPHEPRLVSPGLVVLRGATLTFSRLGAAVTLALNGDHSASQGARPASPQALVRGQRPTRDIQPILFAEDNDVNQRVLSAQLDLLGYPYQIAGNGREALAMWQPDRFSLVLTDLHMPEMDGFSLVAAIRTAEPPGQRIPIVALTANALKDEADRCLAAGMDDYATKPLTFEVLQRLLNAWLPEAADATDATDIADAIAAADPVDTGAALADATPPEPSATGERPPLDIDVLTSTVGDDPAVIQEFLERFRTASLRSRASVAAACEHADWHEAGDQAHQLKSSARAFGAFALADTCESLESICQHDEPTGIAPLLEDLNGRVDALVAFLDQLPNGQEEGVPLRS